MAKELYLIDMSRAMDASRVIDILRAIDRFQCVRSFMRHIMGYSVESFRSVIKLSVATFDPSRYGHNDVLLNIACKNGNG